MSKVRSLYLGHYRLVLGKFSQEGWLYKLSIASLSLSPFWLFMSPLNMCFAIIALIRHQTNGTSWSVNCSKASALLRKDFSDILVVTAEVWPAHPPQKGDIHPRKSGVMLFGWVVQVVSLKFLCVQAVALCAKLSHVLPAEIALEPKMCAPL